MVSTAAGLYNIQVSYLFKKTCKDLIWTKWLHLDYISFCSFDFVFFTILFISFYFSFYLSHFIPFYFFTILNFTLCISLYLFHSMYFISSVYLLEFENNKVTIIPLTNLQNFAILKTRIDVETTSTPWEGIVEKTTLRRAHVTVHSHRTILTTITTKRRMSNTHTAMTTAMNTITYTHRVKPMRWTTTTWSLSFLSWPYLCIISSKVYDSIHKL